MLDPRTQEAIALMMGFAERTGLSSQRPPERYLWTDAFAVCNFLGLAHDTGSEQFKQLALRLVDQVHHTLGRHRRDSPQSGWISGLDEREGEAHPTRGGLRIGKQLPERRPNEPFDERREWDRDGQYFHYLTQWMHALDQVAVATGQAKYNVWARELAESAYRAFTYLPDQGPRRMYWKMSIDLTRPLVPSMGQHDALDGYITSLQLRAEPGRFAPSSGGPSLQEESAQFAAMAERGDWTTADPLGIGGLLIDAYRIGQLQPQGLLSGDRILNPLLSASLVGIEYYAEQGDLRRSAEQRLAFRELGLAIGLHALRLLRQAADDPRRRSTVSLEARSQIELLMRYAPIGEEIETFWRNPQHRTARTWSEHRDINEVMLATALAPNGFLGLAAPR